MDLTPTQQRLRASAVEAAGWPVETLRYVAARFPGTGHTRMKISQTDWAQAVAFARRGDETPELAADRLRQYVDLYAERYGSAPSTLPRGEDRP